MMAILLEHNVSSGVSSGVSVAFQWRLSGVSVAYQCRVNAISVALLCGVSAAVMWHNDGTTTRLVEHAVLVTCQ